MIHQQRWTAEKIAQRLDLIAPLVYRRTVDLPPFHYAALEGPVDPNARTAIQRDPADVAEWPVISPHTHWGSWGQVFVLRSRFTVPVEWSSPGPVALYLPLGNAGDFSHPEALIYVDGEPFAACDRHHQEILLRPEWQDGKPHELALHGWTGSGVMSVGSEGESRLGQQLLMGQCRIVGIDQPTRDFVAAARTALGVANEIDDSQPAKGELLNGLDDAFRLLDIREPMGDAFYASVASAQAALDAAIIRAGGSLDVNIFAIGHAHIDVAWLWTLGQTRRKAERTFHTVLRLMEQFPDYKFTQSQPQLYEYVRQDQPALFEAIKQRVADGRWEPIGGMWVEADCNISGGEALARQFLLGRSYFREHFGPDAESPILWLPDVFGYAWNLPQLIREAGLDYFFTIKIGWNQYNRMPYDSFWWQGLDGTRVLTHYSPTPDPGSSNYSSTYNATATPASVLGTWRNFQQKEQARDLLMAFGYGDGGGGPTREMLENIRTMGDFPATPHIRHASALEFFRSLETNSGDALPVWKGELYLEYHRGTYTTQARNKRANRQSEFLLHNAEFFAAWAAVANPQAASPEAQFDLSNAQSAIQRGWQLVCLNQFHDIIPGSSIAAVYRESQAQYAEVRQLAEGVIDDALSTVGASLRSRDLLINPNGHPLHELIFMPASAEEPVPVHGQVVAGGYLLDPGELLPYSIQAPGPLHEPLAGLSVSRNHLENRYLRIELDDAGDIVRIFDKTQGREILPAGAIANQFQAFEDRPMRWDAWDIDIFYDDKRWLAAPAESIDVIEEGPLRATLAITRRILNSRFTQRISLSHASRRIDFDTEIDWQERHVLLKVAFPVDLLTPAATYEVQWGHVERPTHRNTSWDWARFETAAQKWVDVSEDDYGVSLLNDCKYGHDIQDAAPSGTVMRLSLLRSPTYPDPAADQGEHRFRYSLLPHAGRLGAATIAQAYAVNNPPIAYRVGNRPLSRSLSLSKADSSATGSDGGGRELTEGSSSTSSDGGGSMREGGTKSWNRRRMLPFVTCDQENIVIETVKAAEDGDGVIVRLYESLRRRGPIRLRTGFPLAAAWRANLLEENQRELDCQADGLELVVRPFEIVTLRLRPA